MTRPKKNRSARDKQRARDRARRAARHADYPLLHTPPPYRPYGEWIRVPAQAADLFEHPARRDPHLSDDAKDFMDRVIKLGPRYRGHLPMAAVYLDSQLERGVMHVAVNGQPGLYRDVSVRDMAADLSNQEHVDEMRREYPDAGLPERAELITADAASFMIHEVHRHGFFVLDDDHILNMAIPPQKPGGSWRLNGHDWDKQS